MTQRETIRINIIQYSDHTRLIISEDNVGRIAAAWSRKRPNVAQVRAFLTQHGYRAVGDMRQVGDRTLTSRVVPL